MICKHGIGRVQIGHLEKALERRSMRFLALTSLPSFGGQEWVLHAVTSGETTGEIIREFSVYVGDNSTANPIDDLAALVES